MSPDSSREKDYIVGLPFSNKDSVIKNIIQNASIVFCGNTFTSVLGIISFTIMANRIGPKSLAIIVMAQTYTMIMNDLFNIQTWESVIKFGSKNLDNVSISKIIKTNTVIDVVSAIFAFLIASALARPIAFILDWQSNLVSFLQIYSISILFNITTFTIGIPRLCDNFFAIAKIQSFIGIFKLISIMIASFYSESLLVYMYIYLYSDIISNITLCSYSLISINKIYGPKWWRVKLSIQTDHIRFIWWTNLRTIIRVPVRYLDMLVISTTMPIMMVGIYKVYKEIASSLNRLGEPFNQAIFPEFTKLIGNKENSKVINVAQKSGIILLCFAIILVIPMLFTSKFIVNTFFGKEYLVELNVLHSMIVLYGISFITVPINSLFIAAGFAKFSFIIALFTNIIYTGTIYIFGSIIGIYGIVLAYGAQLFLNKLLKIYILMKHKTGWSSLLR